MTQLQKGEGFSKVLKAVFGILLLAVGGLYLSGWIFLKLMAMDPLQASPLTLIKYFYYFSDRPGVSRSLLWATIAGLGIPVAATLFIAFAPRKPPLHGNARFATKSEIKAAGLLGYDGIILGRYGNKYLALPGQQGVELEAAPRLGKGVSFVIPNLLNWPGSLICNDVKMENFQKTAGFRASHGHEVHLFNPLAIDERTSRWNPLAYVSTKSLYKTIDDLQRISRMLYPDPTTGDPFWSTSARSLFLGIALYLFQKPDATKTLGEILRQGMASDAEGFQKHWKRVIDTCEQAGYVLSQETVQILYDVIDLAPVTASSIRKSFTSRLDLWLNPLIDAATSDNDFDLRDLRKRPISIYVCINPDDIQTLQPIINLFFQQAIGLQTRELPEHNPELKYQLLLMMDEFKSLGRIPVIADSTAYLPGYNVRTAIVVQSSSQYVETYGVEGAKSLRKMLAARIAFAPRDYDDAEAISKELGTYTVKQKTRSYRAFDNKGSSVSVSEQPRRLLLPQEVKELGNRRLILFYEGLRPVLANKIFYYEDRNFKRRIMKPPVVPKLDLSLVKPMPAPPRLPGEDEGPAEGSNEITAAAEAAVKKRRSSRKKGESTPQPVDKQITAADVANAEKLGLESFSLNFDDVVIPKGRPLTEGEVQDAVDAFLSNLVD